MIFEKASLPQVSQNFLTLEIRIMKRLVVYEDDDGDDMPIAPPISARIVKSAVTAAEAPPTSKKGSAGREIYLEETAFKEAFQKAENVVASTTTRTKVNTNIDLAVGDVRRDGPWAPFPSEADEQEQERLQWEAELERRKRIKAEQEIRPAMTTTTIQPKEPTQLVPISTPKQTCERHGTTLVDYQRRSFTDERRWPPAISYFDGDDAADDDNGEDNEDDEAVTKLIGKRRTASTKSRRRESRIPSQTSGPATREYIGHTGGINKVRLFGCLALTAGMDGAVMIWDTSLPSDIAGATHIGMADERGAIQTYWGHDGRAVKDCVFPSTPHTFVSCGYDGVASLWDTETGQIKARFSAKEAHVPANAVRFKPDDDNQLLVAFGDRRLRHWDIREHGDKPSQTYDFHQSAVNSVNFCEQGQKFVSTGDDRKLLVWDWGVPSPVKIISEIWLPSMPTTATHPDSMSFVSVGLDNKIFQFRVHPQSGVIRKSGECSPESFRVAGFSCEPSFSPCGKLLACGDGAGTIHFVKTRAAFSNQSTSSSRFSTDKIVHAHASNTCVACVQFHPCFDGVLLSAGWDGKLKWWQ